MNRLVATLESLTTKDSSPDYEVREVELSGLIRHLTETEIRDLRVQLNSRIIPNDPCRRFPIEIVQEIARYLDLEEVIRARHVSKSWLEVLGGHEISQKLLKWHFSWIWARDYKDLSQKMQGPNERSPQRVLLAQAEKSSRRKRGLYFSTATYKVPTKVETMDYCDGRLGFLGKGGETIHLWNLRTNSRTTYVDENRQKLYSFRLSKSLLVYSPNGLVLMVKNLDLPDSVEPTRIHLPSRLKHYWAHHDQVGIILNSFEIMIWKWGGSLRQVDTSGLRSIINSPSTGAEHDLGLVFHPYDANKIFTVTYVTSESNPYEPHQSQIIISEGSLVNNGWNWKAVHEESSSISKRSDFSDRPSLIGCHKHDFGILKIAKLISNPKSRHMYSFATGKQIEWEYTTFNMLTREVEKSTYLLPDWYEGQYLGIDITDIVLFGGDQVLFPVQKADIDGSENSGAGIVALKGPPDYTALSRTTMNQTPDSAKKLINSWTGGTFIPSPDPHDPLHNAAPISVTGDDDFVILLGKHDFVVWCFDETVVLPHYSTAE